MAPRQSPSQDLSVSRPSLSQRPSLSRLSNPDVCSNDFALSSHGMSSVNQFTIARKPVASRDAGYRFERVVPIQDSDKSSEDEDRPDRCSKLTTSKEIVDSVLYGWKLEILSYLVAIVALAAIFITLIIHQGRPLPQWPHLISINALISIFTSIFKAALIMPVGECMPLRPPTTTLSVTNITVGMSQLKWLWFRHSNALIDLDQLDSASRGPWGSLKLVWSVSRLYVRCLSTPLLKATHKITLSSYLAVSGALITIIALAIDPFSQQIINYTDCAQPLPNAIASISRTNNYSAYGFRWASDENTLDAPMINTLYSGLINPPENPASLIVTECPTGNCTFPSDNGASHSSLAMCHSCEDISSQITSHGFNWTRSFITDDNFTLSIPSGAFLNYSIFATAAPCFDPSNLTSEQEDNLPEDLFSFSTLMMNIEGCDQELGGGPTGCTLKPWAVNCSIYPCLKTYGGNISQHLLNEVVLQSIRVPRQFAGDGWYSPFMLVQNSTLRNGIWQDCKPTSKPTRTNTVGYKWLGCIDDNCEESKYALYYPDDCVWYFDVHSIRGMINYLSTLMQGSIGPMQYWDPEDTSGDIWIQKLYHNGTANMSTVNTYMEGLTNAITATMRYRGDTNSSGYAKGTVMTIQTCITVQWTWISLPAALLVLTLGFLSVTILQTSSHSGEMTWKSSSLALLFHGLSPDLRAQYGTLREVHDMKTSAKHLQARLQRTHAGWAFVETKEE